MMMTAPERELHEYISETSERTDVGPGSPLPLGTQERAGGVNFALFSRHASRVRLELFSNSEHDAPARVIDLDILFFGQKVIREGGLQIPHPRLQERRFVLVPLQDIAPHLEHPLLGKTISQILADLKKEEKVLAVPEAGQKLCLV
ncbi:MAG: 2-amino-4-hydroxy-6-hydroxymethyldihydropteridine diphosphokinase [Steroidobacteraceae bacterium]